MDAGFDPVIRMARKMGISSPLGRNLSLSLGTSEVSLMELTSAYTVFPNSGIHVQPVLVKRIEDRLGNVLEDNSAIPLLEASEIPRPTPREEMRAEPNVSFGPEASPSDEEEELNSEESAQETTSAQGTQPKDGETSQKTRPEGKTARRVRAAMSPQTAYVMTSLLQGGVARGTGHRMAQYVKRRDVAGKTGTTNRAADTWFVGFNQELTAGVWIGFDEARPLGRGEEGGRAALPVWGYFMKAILQGTPEKEFPVPPDITFRETLTIDSSSKEGSAPKTVREPIYTPFVGRTLIISPLDPPETLAPYRGPAFPVNYPPAYPGGAPPVQQGWPMPLNPMDGRNLFPEETRPVQVPPVAPPQSPGPGFSQPPVPPALPRDFGGPAASAVSPIPSPSSQEAPPPPDATSQMKSKARYEPRFYQQQQLNR
jgi:penicillin-binding protein 1A